MMELQKKEYVVMVDIHFLGIYVQAMSESEANDVALIALDNLRTEHVIGVEYGLRGTKVVEVKDEQS
jgi:hypothetical protein